MIKECFYPEELKRAYDNCIRTKKNKSAVIDYDSQAPIDLIELLDEINTGRYVIGPSNAFIVKFPKYREVFAAMFRDRIVHHLIIDELMPVFEELFVENTYSCRVSKGVLYGVNHLWEQIRECSDDYTKDAWILKLDIRAFFMSIDKTLLAERVHNFIEEKYNNPRKKRILDRLCRMVILHHPERNCIIRCRREEWRNLSPDKSLFTVIGEKGLPIGNLTSQVFANFYLHPLDVFITQTLGFKCYGRYVDDFAIVSRDKQKLLEAQRRITEFARKELRLEIHHDKRYIQHVRNGVQFIGSIIKGGRKYIINRTVDSLYHKMNHLDRYGLKTPEDIITVVNSYMGFLMKCNSYNIRKRFFKSDVMKPWIENYFIIAKGYSKIQLRPEYKQKKTAELLQTFDL